MQCLLSLKLDFKASEATIAAAGENQVKANRRAILENLWNLASEENLLKS
jgi:hypothetical protein